MTKTAITIAIIAQILPLSSSQSFAEEHLPKKNEALEKLCVAEGGSYARGGLLGNFICFKPTSDGGKLCLVNSQCETYCLARTLTCAKVNPLIGKCFSHRPKLFVTSEVCLD